MGRDIASNYLWVLITRTMSCTRVTPLRDSNAADFLILNPAVATLRSGSRPRSPGPIPSHRMAGGFAKWVHPPYLHFRLFLFNLPLVPLEVFYELGFMIN